MGKPKIVLATVGSLGDLHPFIAIGVALKARGASPVLAVPQDQIDKCLKAGLHAEALLPTFAELGRATGFDDDAIVRKVIEDIDFLLRQILLPPMADSVDRLLRISAGAQAMVGSIFALAAPVVAARDGIPFVSAVLQPMSWFSPTDPPLAPGFGAFARPPLGHLRGRWNRFVMAIAGREMRRRYGAQINAVRASHGLPKSDRPPIFQPGIAPSLSLGLYSPLLGKLPKDAPAPAILTGFPWFDSGDGGPPALQADLAAFLAAGPAPLVVSLGSLVPFAAAEFYTSSIEVARKLGMRAVLLTSETMNVSSPDVIVSSYAPHSLLFPHAAAIIHHGGVGTTGQALRAGRPQLVVPFMADQFDHADRITRLGVGLSTTSAKFASDGAAFLGKLLNDGNFATRALDISEQIAADDGAGIAADAILRMSGELRDGFPI